MDAYQDLLEKIDFDKLVKTLLTEKGKKASPTIWDIVYDFVYNVYKKNRAERHYHEAWDLTNKVIDILQQMRVVRQEGKFLRMSLDDMIFEELVKVVNQNTDSLGQVN